MEDKIHYDPANITQPWSAEQYQHFVKTGHKPTIIPIKKAGLFILDVNPVPKPRMTRQDKWKERPVTKRYWSYKEDLLACCEEQGLTDIPAHIKRLSFFMQMPKTWSKVKRNEMCGKDHADRPDLDNLLKAFQDCLCKQDQHICRIKDLSKVWEYNGKIEIEL